MGKQIDAGSVAVALKLTKYLREVCMRPFNAFWRTHVPDLKRPPATPATRSASTTPSATR